MKRALLFAWVTAFCLSTFGVAQEHASSCPTASEVHYSRAQLRQLTKEAHTQSQYQALAEHFRNQQQRFQQQAHSEEQEWVRRSQFTVGVAQKYPRPADSAKNLYDYYAYEADQNGKLAAQYEKLAQQAPQLASNH
jgi:spore coat polysaccharide biosynthesis protein SpsF (cytidylyltransferase family)